MQETEMHFVFHSMLKQLLRLYTYILFVIVMRLKNILTDGKKRDLVATSDSKPRVFSVLMTSIAALLHYHQFQMLLKTKRKRIN
jgi:hypothetical protein